MKKFYTFLAALALAVSAFAQSPQEAMMMPLPNDPAIRIGHLDNGLTYYIRHNDKPASRAEFYLATNVGAVQEEQPSQDGLAHFLEHMCFNGTVHFPDKGILDYLRSIGAEFGRNINASTGFEETQYMLNNIPVERESVVDTCLMILCDYAHFVVNDPAEIDKERGVIIEERRQRRDASWRSMEAALPYYFRGTKMANVTLIGTQEHLETFKPESLVSFYRTWYHPDMQAVVVVGDIDVDRTEKKIQEIFSQIPAEPNPKPKDILSLPGNSEPIVGIYTDPELTNPEISLAWTSAAAPEAYNASIMGKMQNTIKQLVASIMRERFEDITSDPQSPYLGGSLFISSLIYEDIDAVMADVNLKQDNILGGLEAFYTEVEKMKRFGFSEDEVDRAKTNLLTRYQNAAEKASTRKNPEFVRPILSNFFDKYPILDPETDYELMKQLLPNINSQILNMIAAQLITDENLLILYNGPEKEGIATPSEAELLAVVNKVKAAEIKPNASAAVASEFLDASKLKGSKIKKIGTAVYGSTEWILANGVRVLVLPTKHTKDQILFDIFKDGGRSLIETADLDTFDDSVWGLYLNNTGVAGFSGTEVSKMLTGKSLRVNPYISNLEHGVSGNSTVRDFETALQLVYLYFTSPRFDEKEWSNGIEQLRAYLPNYISLPDYKFSEQLTSTIYGNNPRRKVVSMETLDKASLKTLEKVYRNLFKDAAGATLTIVGDVDLEAIKPLIQKYIGSLPKGKKALKWNDRKEYFVDGPVQNVFTADMQTPKSTTIQLYHALTPWTPETKAALDAAKYILDIRYTNSLREDEGGTYGAGVAARMMRRPRQEALVQVYFDSKPALCDRLRELAVQGIEDLAANGPTADETSQAILNLSKNIPERRVTNNYWKECLESWIIYGTDDDATREAAIQSLTPESIRKTVADMLSSGNRIEVVMKPAKTAEAE
ncbi:MAG: insulinase family protein [Bacteroidales bacterium]|nr:insulinase family protein [Bacteroidales bacterium]